MDEKNYWQRKAVAYLSIIKEAKGCINPRGDEWIAFDILNEADKIEKNIYEK